MTAKDPAEQERRREARLAMIRSALEEGAREGAGEASSTQSGAPTSMQQLSSRPRFLPIILRTYKDATPDLFQATVSLQDSHQNLYDAHAEAEASYEHFQYTLSQLSDLYKPPSLPASPVRAYNSQGTPRVGDTLRTSSVSEVRLPFTQPQTPQTPTKKRQPSIPMLRTVPQAAISSGAVPSNVTQLPSPSAEFDPVPVRQSALDPETTDEPVQPSTLSPETRKGFQAYVIYNGKNGCHGVYQHWVESQKGLCDGVFYFRGDSKNGLLKGFNSLEEAERSYTEMKQSGILSLFQNPVDTKREKFVVVRGIKPGVYKERARLLRDGLGYRRGLVERYLTDHVTAQEIFNGYVAEGAVEVLSVND
ncbi:hypothetical protein K435DRAFT_800440 [Dendrothele bispora CBS 962.96]|uniref:Uncharacterized protein n=1 Tax=Dendrothele bispora (strain CBS 962.96) TaxID=1314807 RepID=A0A4S8LT92_DENBC|nr:hypothetical protein K435DRAFT_800440 [Dendrothele bispora CBS 962.96]